MIERCKRHILRTNGIVIGLVVIFAVLIWKSGDWFLPGSVITFGPLHNYVFIWISILIASVAALNSILASLIARDSQRPFLNVSRIHINWSKLEGSPTTIINFLIGVDNTGNFPADEVSILFNVRKGEGDSEQHQFLMREESPIYFPNENKPNLHFSEPDDKEKLVVEQGGRLQVQIKISYKNKLTHSSHKTFRSYRVQYTPTVQESPLPLPEGDYWD